VSGGYLSAFEGLRLAWLLPFPKSGSPHSPQPPAHPSYGLAATCCAQLCVLVMLPFLYMDACTLIAYSAGWAASPWNM
jgi:hypothetical protein